MTELPPPILKQVMDPAMREASMAIMKQLIALDALLPDEPSHLNKVNIRELEVTVNQTISSIEQMVGTYYNVAVRKNDTMDVNRYITYSKTTSSFTFKDQPIEPLFLHWVYSAEVMENVVSVPKEALTAEQPAATCGSRENNTILPTRNLIATAAVGRGRGRRKAAPAPKKEDLQKQLDSLTVPSPEQMKLIQTIVDGMTASEKITAEPPTEEKPQLPPKAKRRRENDIKRDPVYYLDIVTQGVLVIPIILQRMLRAVFRRFEDIPFLQVIFAPAAAASRGTGISNGIMTAIELILRQIHVGLPDRSNIEAYTKGIASMIFFSAVGLAIYIHYSEGLPALATTAATLIESTIGHLGVVQQSIIDIITGTEGVFSAALSAARMKLETGRDGPIPLLEFAFNTMEWVLLLSTNAVIPTTSTAFQVGNIYAFKGVFSVIGQASSVFDNLRRILIEPVPIVNIPATTVFGFLDSAGIFDFILLIPKFLSFNTMISLVQKILLKLLTLLRKSLEAAAERVTAAFPSALISLLLFAIDAVIVAVTTVPFGIKVFLTFTISWSLFWRIGILVLMYVRSGGSLLL